MTAGKERNFRSPPARRRSGIRLRRSGFPRMPGRSGRRIFEAKPARGAGRDDRLTAAGRAFRKERQGSAKDDGPKKGRERTVGGDTGLELACQGETREAGSGPDRSLEGCSAPRSAASSKRRRGPGPSERNGDRAKVFGLELLDPGGAGRAGWKRRKGRKAGTWRMLRGRARETGQPIETDATPERVREDRGTRTLFLRDGVSARSEDRQSQARRSGARQQCRAPFLFGRGANDADLPSRPAALVRGSCVLLPRRSETHGRHHRRRRA